MTARGRHHQRGFTGPKRQVTWVGPADQGFTTVAAGTKVLVASFDPQAAGLPKPTVVRTRGDVSIIPDSAAADVRITGAYGLAVVSDRAFAAGVASVPGPFSDASWDGWFVWRSFNYSLQFADSTGFIQEQMSQEVDSKAMRKVTEDETIVLVAESQGSAFDISMPLRLLLKLS